MRLSAALARILRRTQGRFSLALQLGQTPTPNGPVSVLAGEAWNFTAWYRDSVWGVPASNFTHRLRVDFR